MSVWYCVPSARPAEEANRVLNLWQQQGYMIALWRDIGFDKDPLSDLVIHGEYPGYAQATNALVHRALQDPKCDWVVIGGDDVEPDLNHTAQDIAYSCEGFFRGLHTSIDKRTFGVMQPTGDRFAGGCIDRIAGSAWIGREFAQRINQGNGPLWPEFTHMFSDECLKGVAEKLGVYWMRPDLIHLHRHFMRESESIDSQAVSRPIPAHLVEANSPEHWRKSKEIFERLKADGFGEYAKLAY